MPITVSFKAVCQSEGPRAGPFSYLPDDPAHRPPRHGQRVTRVWDLDSTAGMVVRLKFCARARVKALGRRPVGTAMVPHGSVRGRVEPGRHSESIRENSKHLFDLSFMMITLSECTWTV